MKLQMTSTQIEQFIRMQ